MFDHLQIYHWLMFHSHLLEAKIQELQECKYLAPPTSFLKEWFQLAVVLLSRNVWWWNLLLLQILIYV